MPAHGFRNSWQLRSVVWVEQSTDHGHPRKGSPPVDVCQRSLLRLMHEHANGVREVRVRATDRFGLFESRQSAH
jgi:hypothetical protein